MEANEFHGARKAVWWPIIGHTEEFSDPATGIQLERQGRRDKDGFDADGKVSLRFTGRAIKSGR